MLDRLEIPPSRSERVEAVIIAKALPQIGEKHGETVCVAALDVHGRWFRFYPVPFRQLNEGARFKRWNVISVETRLVPPNKDRRQESRNIDSSSIRIIGTVKKGERCGFVERALINSTKTEYESGRSLAVIRPDDPKFYWKPRSPEAIEKRRKTYAEWAAQGSFLDDKQIAPLTPAPYDFFYRFRTEDGVHDCQCHDWEVEQTFVNWERKFGEERALKEMSEIFGRRYPAEGMALAMGTHSRYPKNWMIIGVLKVPFVAQAALL
jgi:hypothetical protein